MPILNIIILSLSFWLFLYILSWSINHRINKKIAKTVFDGGSAPFGHSTCKYLFKNFDSSVVVYFVFIICLFMFPWVIVYNQTKDARYGTLLLVLIVISLLIFGFFYKFKKIRETGEYDK